ncbi:EAL domain-containing protein [Paraburkholderia sp. Ac-20340]|uniref:sensor domain-containing protein n=1 Tax=Paraburkholderia sp. Ac-20340 TaxID=2703888 RepID=UPI0019814E46|nr:EAL domain-containing protein [Paraburkholderia sp. Ac-20340]MBN3853361.1 EAL domain-containing protein [Paraburkholderia sp. Ac-20340]
MNSLSRVQPHNDVYELLVQSITRYAIYMLDIDGFVATWNSGAEQKKGYREEEILGRHFSCFYSREDRLNQIPARNLHVARTKGRYEAYGWRLRKNGTAFRAHVVIDALRDPQGELFGFAKITRDCTDIAAFDTLPAEGEDVSRSPVSGAEHAMLMLDADGLISHWSASAQMSGGYCRDDVVGRHYRSLYTADDQASGRPERELRAAMREGRFEGDGWRVRKDGVSVWSHVLIEPIYHAGNELFGYAVLTQDRTEARRIQQQSLDHERRFRMLVEGVTDYAIYMLDTRGCVSNWNAGAQRAKGYSAEEIVGRHFSLFYTEEARMRGAPESGLRQARETGKFEAEGWRLRKDGGKFWAHVVIQPIYDDAGELFGYAKITRDRTEQQESALTLEATRRNLDLALDNMRQGLCLFDQQERLVIANRQFSLLFDMYEAPAAGASLSALLWRIGKQLRGQSANRAALMTQFRRVIAASSTPDTATEVNLANRVISVTTRQLSHGGWVSTLEDVTLRHAAEKQVRHLALHDPLTDLPNRFAFHAKLQHRLADLRRSQPFCLLYLDLDRFKSVNDTFGHHSGDELLRAVAQRLAASVREGDQLARLGGDEFTIILNTPRGVDDARALAMRCIEMLSKPFALSRGEASIGVSIGIVELPRGVDVADKALERADLALYAAKAAGRNCFRVFEGDMHDAASQRNELEFELRRAMSAEDLQIHYQLIVDGITGMPTACEALLRWPHPRHGNIPPSKFIPLAEERGLMPELGAWVLRQACLDAAQLPMPLRLHVNVSAAQVTRIDFVDTVAQVIRESGLPASQLEIEITETALLESSETLRSVLNSLRALGIGIAMDDFGTGYSSLSLLRDFSFTSIKIDRSFVKDVEESRKSRAIVRSIVGLCKDLNIAVIAEGVETEQQRDILVHEGCTELQGFLFARPVALSDIKASLPDWAV